MPSKRINEGALVRCSRTAAREAVGGILTRISMVSPLLAVELACPFASKIKVDRTPAKKLVRLSENMAVLNRKPWLIRRDLCKDAGVLTLPIRPFWGSRVVNHCTP